MTRRLLLAVAVVGLVGPALAGCLSSTNTPAATNTSPPPSPTNDSTSALPDQITGIEHVTQVGDVGSGSGIFVHGDHAYISGGSTFQIVNVSDPEAPAVVGTIDDISSRDAAILEYGDHRHAAVLAAQDEGFHVINVTDPAEPERMTTYGKLVSHNAGVLPGTTLVYNSAGSGRGGQVQILNLSDPANPKPVATFGKSGCHDIEFWQGDNESILICAGEAATELYDITEDPTDPQYITEIRNPFISLVGFAGGDGGALTPGLHHWALLSPDGETLIIGDEFMGGLAPGCYLYNDDTGRTVASPIGALWFYDVSDRENPELEGWFSPPVPAESSASQQNPSCTAHFGETIKDHLVAVGWYSAGTILVDYSDPANPTMVDQFNPGTDTWDVRRIGNHLITGDIIRGSDVLKLTGS